MPILLPMALTKAQSIGFSIATKTVSCMIVDGKEVKQAQSLASSPCLEATTVHHDVLLAALKEIKQSLNLTVASVAVCIPEKYAFSRTYVLPKLALSEIDEAVRWQVEKLFPYAEDEIYTDWRLISKTGSTTTVVVTAVPRPIINGIKDCLLAARLFPSSIEPSVTALARLVPESKSPVVVVEIDSTSSSATIVDQSISQVTATSFYDEVSAPDAKAIVISKSISDLVTHWQKDKVNVSPLPVLLTGEAADEALVKLLSTKTNLTCEILPVPNVPVGYHIAYAAATSTIKPPISELSINLIPPGLQTYYQTATLYQRVNTAIVQAAIILTIGLLGIIGGYVAIQIIGNAKLKQVANLSQPIVTAATPVNLNQLTKNATRFKRLYEKKVTPEHIISTVIQAIPEGTTLTTISYDPTKRKIHLGGKADDREAIIKLREQLAQTNLFKTADVPLSAYSTSATGVFSFELEVKKP